MVIIDSTYTGPICQWKRTRHNGKRHYNDAKYANFKRRISWWMKANKIRSAETGQLVSLNMVFMMGPPAKSNKAVIGDPHLKTPDIDNLAKGVMDAGQGILWADDKQIASLSVSKMYSKEVGVRIAACIPKVRSDES